VEIALLDGGPPVVAFLPLGVAPSSCIAVEHEGCWCVKTANPALFPWAVLGGVWFKRFLYVGEAVIDSGSLL